MSSEVKVRVIAITALMELIGYENHVTHIVKAV